MHADHPDEMAGSIACRTTERDVKAIEAAYGENVLVLSVVRAYIRRLLENPQVAQFLAANYADIHTGFTALAAMESL